MSGVCYLLSDVLLTLNGPGGRGSVTLLKQQCNGCGGKKGTVSGVMQSFGFLHAVRRAFSLPPQACAVVNKRY